MAAKAAIKSVAWNAIHPAPVVLISGGEDVIAERAQMFLLAIMRDEDPSLEITDIEADNYAKGELFTFVSPSLFGEPRLIRVDRAEKATDAFIEDVIAYLGSLDGDTTLIIRHAGGVRGKKLLDAIRARPEALEISCIQLKKESEKEEFVLADVRSRGRKISREALRALVAAFSEDFRELAAATLQLLDDVPGEIGEGDVARAFGGRAETNAFAVADHAIAGRKGEALVGLRQALAQGIDPVPIVAVFALKIRTLAKVSGAFGGGDRATESLGLAPWQVDRARKDLRGWNDVGLARVIEAVAEADAAVKGAERDPVYAVERLVLAVAAKGEYLNA